MYFRDNFLEEDRKVIVVAGMDCVAPEAALRKIKAWTQTHKGMLRSASAASSDRGSETNPPGLMHAANCFNSNALILDMAF